MRIRTDYSEALAYVLISQLRQISSNCGVVHSIVVFPTGAIVIRIAALCLHTCVKNPAHDEEVLLRGIPPTDNVGVSVVYKRKAFITSIVDRSPQSWIPCIARPPLTTRRSAGTANSAATSTLALMTVSPSTAGWWRPWEIRPRRTLPKTGM